MPTEDQKSTIETDIRNWSKLVLEKPIDVYGGMPVCPFAKNAWIKGKVKITFVESMRDVMLIANKFDHTDDRIEICVLINSGGLEIDQFDACIESLNICMNGVWLMGSHHEENLENNMPKFIGRSDIDYCLVMIQSLKHLVDSSEKLKNTRYYESFNTEDMQYINHRRRCADARNESRNVYKG